ncbi:MAG: lectin-like protein [Lacipirellulaceae bacterium]
MGAITKRFLAAACPLALCGVMAAPALGQTGFRELGRTKYAGTGNLYVLVSLSNGAPMNAFRAREAATAFDGWLFDVQDRAEEVFVVEALRGKRTAGPWDGDFWIGLNDRAVENTFVWDSGATFSYRNWAEGEPNDSSGEDWAEIWRLDGEISWNDETDGHNSNFAVIEKLATPDQFRLEIDPNTGYARIVSLVQQLDLSKLRSYEITSATGALNAAAWSATNLATRALDSIGAAGSGQKWEVLNDSTGQLSEAFLLGGSVLERGESLVLGKILPTGAGQVPVTFNYSVDVDFEAANRGNVSNEAFFSALVQYVSFAAPRTPGDYNGDGAVNAGDYTVWRDALGSTTNLAADGNQNGTVDQADYAVWAGNYGASSAAATAVPEPIASLLLLVAAACPAARRR